jgi:hypothetical protein
VFQHIERWSEEETDPDIPGDRLRREAGDRLREGVQVQQVHGGDRQRQHGQQGRKRFYSFLRSLQQVHCNYIILYLFYFKFIFNEEILILLMIFIG